MGESSSSVPCAGPGSSAWRRAHRHVDEAQPAHGLGRRGGERGHGRDHRIEQRQRERGADAAQKVRRGRAFFVMIMAISSFGTGCC